VPAESEEPKVFRQLWLEGNRAWQERDLEGAYGALPQDFEYHPAPVWPMARPLHGPAEIIEFFEDFQESFADVRTEVIEFIQVDEGTIIVGFRAIGTGEFSGASTAMEVWQVWRFQKAPDRPEAVGGLLASGLSEFLSRDEALKAARVTEDRTLLRSEGE
jgi:SnoaL-like domain